MSLFEYFSVEPIVHRAALQLQVACHPVLLIHKQNLFFFFPCNIRQYKCTKATDQKIRGGRIQISGYQWGVWGSAPRLPTGNSFIKHPPLSNPGYTPGLNVHSLPYIDQCSSTMNPVYCGVCCPSINGCCATTSDPVSTDEVCCAMEANNAARDCGSTRCPDRLPSGLVYDSAVTPAELRNQCCVYFRDGCCSESENSSLDLL